MNRVVNKFLFLVLCLVGYGVVNGQNPFELKNRLPDSSGIKSTGVQTDNPFEKNRDELPTIGQKQNPFEITQKQTSEPKILSPIKKKRARQAFFKSQKGNHLLSHNFLFWVLSFLSLLLAVITNIDRQLMLNLFKAWGNANFTNLLHRNKKDQDHLLMHLLALVFYVNAGLFIAQTLHLFFDVSVDLRLLALIVAIIASTYLVRYATLSVLSSIFSVGKEALQYGYTISLFNVLLGILLLIVNIIIAFASPEIGRVIIYFTAGTISIQYLYRLVRGLLIASPYISNSKIHFFLYLCTCEIAPIAIIVSWLNRLG